MGAAVGPVDAAELPRSAREVVAEIRRSSVESFAALRHTSECARALHPPPGSLPASLPAFILPTCTLLPGERADFTLFEPRYLALARHALGLDGGAAPPDGRYAHLPDSASGAVGTVASILSHQSLSDGQVVVRVLAGPRARLVRTSRLEEVHRPGGEGGPPLPPLQHVALETLADEPGEDAAADAALARECLERLAKLVPLDQLPQSVNVPPLLSPERLSLWLCGVILRANDTTARVQWLCERSTRKRLEFVASTLARESPRGASES